MLDILFTGRRYTLFNCQKLMKFDCLQSVWGLLHILQAENTDQLTILEHQLNIQWHPSTLIYSFYHLNLWGYAVCKKADSVYMQDIVTRQKVHTI